MRAPSLWLLLCLVWPLGWCASVSAQSSGTSASAQPAQPAQGPRLQEMHEPGSIVVLPWPELPAGTCAGGSCEGAAAGATLLDYARVRPGALPMSRAPTPRRERFAYAGAALGGVTAGLALGGSLAIAVADDRPSERVTRGLWLGVASVSAPLVALSVYLARKESGFSGYQGLRRFGWLAYGLAVADGAFLWSSAFRDEPATDLLTVAAGVFAVLAVLPHALEAVSAGRSLRMRRVTQRLRTSASGLTLRF